LRCPRCGSPMHLETPHLSSCPRCGYYALRRGRLSQAWRMHTTGVASLLNAFEQGGNWEVYRDC
jgi:ribosomal protein L32